MNRRDSTMALLALCAAPISVLAQPVKVWRIGFLSNDNASFGTGQRSTELFPKALAKLGYQVGVNLIIEWRWGNQGSDNLSELARDLVRLGVDLIVARSNVSIEAAMTATQTIPIVMFTAIFPVEMGLVKSLTQPGGNVTGTTYLHSPEIVARTIQILKEVAPRSRRLAVLWQTDTAKSRVGELYREALERAARRFGMKVQYYDVSRVDEIPATLRNIASNGSDSLWISTDAVFRARLEVITAFLIEKRLASVGMSPGFTIQGGLVGYAPAGLDYFDRTASFVDHILKGKRPVDLAVEEPMRYYMRINLKTAKAIGLKVPQSAVLQAEIID